MNRMKAGLCVAFAVTVGMAHAAVIVDDTFGDGSIGSNAGGIGTGFVQFENTEPGDGTVPESGGLARIQSATNANYQITGMASKDNLGVGALDTLTVVWDIDSVSDTDPNSLQLSVQGGTGYNEAPFITLQMNRTDTLYVKGKKVGGGEVTLGTLAFSKSDLTSGFSATLTASASGWQYDFTGLGSVSSMSGGYGSDSFTDLIGNGSRVGAAIQRYRWSHAGIASELNINQITANVIPEPAALGLVAFAGGALFWVRRTFMI